MPLFTNYGKAKATIARYMKDIEQRYIPAVNQALNLNINNYPRIARETYATYVDDESGAALEISSNHRDLDNKNDLFVAVSYDGMKEDAGIINLDDMKDAVEMTSIAFQELGLKTPEQIKQDEEQKEKDRLAAEEQRKQKAADLAKRKEELRREAERGDTEVDEEEPIEEPEEDTYEEDKPQYQSELNRSLKFLSETPEGTSLELDWLYIPNSDNKEKIPVMHVLMNMTHVSGENFLIETKRVNPKVQTIANIQKSIEYANKVSDKIRTTPQMNMKDEKGRPLQLPEDMSDEDIEDDEFAVDI